MNIFLDANILVSVLNNEYPAFTYSARVLSLADSSRFKIYTSPICLAIAFYFSEKKSGTAMAKQKIEMLSRKLNIADCNKTDVLQAISNKKVNDLEDGMEYYAAMRAKCKCIVTQDVTDFYFADAEVLNAEDFVENYLIKK